MHCDGLIHHCIVLFLAHTHAYIRTGTCVSTHMHTHINTHIHTYIHTNVHTYKHTHTYIHAYKHTHIYTHTQTHTVHLTRKLRGSDHSVTYSGNVSLLSISK